MDIYFEEKGNPDAPSIVFVHGGAMNRQVWEQSVKHFSQYHCILVDLPEHGNSTNVGPFSISESERQIANIIKARANGGKAHVIGHSLGAVVLIELLSKHADLVNYVVIASGNLRPAYVYKILSSSLVSRLQSYLIRKKGKYFVTYDMLQRLYEEVVKNLRIPEGLSRVTVPCLLIAGEREPKFVHKSNQDLLKVLTNSKAILIKGAGHSYPWLDSQTFNDIAESWITKGEISSERIIGV